MFRLNEKVRIKKEWCDSEFDRTLTWEVIGIYDEAKRCVIKTYLPDMILPITQAVSVDMIEKVTE